jgi:acetyl esterase/lipase
VVLWIHGGRWSCGSRRDAVTRAFTARGLAVASLDYRLAPAARFPAQLADCQAAVRWLRQHAGALGLDGERVAAFGLSAGGHLAALLATGAEVTPEGSRCAAGSDARVQAAVDWSGPVDLLGAGERERALRRMAAVLLGGPPAQREALARAADPARCASADAASMLIVHGTADALVPPRHSLALHEALTSRGARATLELLPGAGHDLQSPERYEEAAAFLAGALGGGPEARPELVQRPVGAAGAGTSPRM